MNGADKQAPNLTAGAYVKVLRYSLRHKHLGGWNRLLVLTWLKANAPQRALKSTGCADLQDRLESDIEVIQQTMNLENAGTVLCRHSAKLVTSALATLRQKGKSQSRTYLAQILLAAYGDIIHSTTDCSCAENMRELEEFAASDRSMNATRSRARCA